MMLRHSACWETTPACGDENMRPTPQHVSHHYHRHPPCHRGAIMMLLHSACWEITAACGDDRNRHLTLGKFNLFRNEHVHFIAHVHYSEFVIPCYILASCWDFYVSSPFLLIFLFFCIFFPLSFYRIHAIPS